MPRLTPQEIVLAIRELSAPELRELEAACSALGLFSESNLFHSMPTPDSQWLHEQRTSCDVELTETGADRIGVIRLLRGEAGLGLNEAAYAAAHTPAILKEDVPKPEAESLKEILENAGARVTLK